MTQVAYCIIFIRLVEGFEKNISTRSQVDQKVCKLIIFPPENLREDETTSLKLTAKALKMGHPKKEAHLPTINFQVLC